MVHLLLTFVILFRIFKGMNGFQKKLEDFLRGRHGSDQLSFTLSLLGLVLVFCSPAFSSQGLRTTLSFLGIALVIYSVFRVFSKDDAARTKENEAFMRLCRRDGATAARRRAEKERKARMKEKLKTHELFYCPKCKAACYVPKGKGKVRITCPKCGEKFIGKT